MGILLIVLFFTSLFFTGRLLLKIGKFNDSNTIFVEKLAISLPLGLSLYIFLAHVISYLTSSYKMSVWISFSLILALFILFLLINQKSLQALRELFLLENLSVLLLGGFISISMYFRNEIFGTPDRIHTAIASTIAENAIYPPASPVDQNLSLDFYHHGTDLVMASLKIILNISSWKASSVHIGLGAFLFFLSLYALMRFFIKNHWLSLFAAFVISFQTSILNSLEFFLREFIKLLTGINIFDFLTKWLLVSWTSVSHISSQLRLPSQNIAFCCAFVLILLLLNLIFCSKGAKKITLGQLINVALLSFLLYLCYPTFWYPIFCAAVACLLLKKKFIELISISISLYVGKLLCFCKNLTEFNGVQVLEWAPSDSWTNWGKGYLRYFYDVDYLRSLSQSFDYVNYQYLLEIPLFSTITLRDFGLISIIALLIWVCKFLINKKLEPGTFLIFIASASLFPTFLFEFIIRPIEITRFLLWAKVIFSIYVFASIFSFVDSYFKNSQFTLSIRSWRLNHYSIAFLFIVMLISTIPGIVSVIPDKRFALLPNKAIAKDDKDLLKALEEIHQSGNIMLSSKDFHHAADLPSLSGFYGIGGQLYKKDSLTKKTALYLMSPKLLNELKVDYILLDSNANVSNQGLQRLKNKELFEEIKLIDKSSAIDKKNKLFKYLGKATIDENKNNDYLWVLAYPKGKNTAILKGSDNKVISANSQEEIGLLAEEYRAKIKNKDLKVAMWLKGQAVAKEWLTAE